MRLNDRDPGPLDAGPRFQIALATALAFAFLLTGAATALLGAVLPVLLKDWAMSDSSGGYLLLLAWGGSTCGALLCRGVLRRAAVTGLLMTAAAMLVLAAIDRLAALALFALYGIGLGITMTAITVLSARRGADSEASRNSIMMRLNLLWSIGACLAPTLATHALTFTRSGSLFVGMGLVFCAAAAAVWLCGQGTNERFAPEETDASNALRAAPWRLYAMAALAVGVESAIGGWLTTYAGRTAHTEAMTISATSAFWAGLLLSRALHSVKGLRWLQAKSAFIAHAAISAGATVALLAAPHTATFLPSALLAGFGLGPLYPRVLALVVGTYKPRAIFIVAGLGSAALPWMTGLASHTAGSLRAGLVLPCVAAVGLLGLMLMRQERAPAIETAR